MAGPSGAKESWTAPDFPRILIIDPRNFTGNLLDTDTKSKLVRAVKVFKKFSEKWFSHVLLLAVLILYTCVGAWIFQSIEGPFEQSQKNPINELRTEIIEKLWKERTKYRLPQRKNDPALPMPAPWIRESRILLSKFDDTVTRACTAGVTTDSEDILWSFLGGLFFSMTVFTTIGYGERPPKTTAGKAITMVYAFIGIPLLLMVLADFGKLFTRGIKFIFKHIRRLYYASGLRKVRRVGRKATLVPTQFVGATLDAVNRKIAYIPYVPQIPKSGSFDDNKNQDNSRKAQSNTGYKTPAFWYAARHPDFRPELVRTPIILNQTPSPPHTSGSSPQTSGVTDPETPMPEEVEVDDEFNLPVTLALSILLIYLLLGAILFWSLEKWTLFESFYFVFISMSTIGFGDFVPKEPDYMIGAFIYLLFGLALTSMCINVVQEKLSSTFHKAKMTIGETIGLDVDQLMAAEINEDKSSSDKDKSRDTSAEKSLPSTKDSSVERKAPIKLKEEGISNSLKDKREKRKLSKSEDKDKDKNKNKDKDKDKGSRPTNNKTIKAQNKNKNETSLKMTEL